MRAFNKILDLNSLQNWIIADLFLELQILNLLKNNLSKLKKVLYILHAIDDHLIGFGMLRASSNFGAKNKFFVDSFDKWSGLKILFIICLLGSFTYDVYWTI
jgi:hypothetical protein